MVIYVDIDGIICNTPKDEFGNLDYKNSSPFEDRIRKINDRFDEGDIIIYWTARGTVSGRNYFGLTLKQLKRWGCKFNELRMGKPFYDIFVDDKSINSIDKL